MTQINAIYQIYSEVSAKFSFEDTFSFSRF